MITVQHIYNLYILTIVHRWYTAGGEIYIWEFVKYFGKNEKLMIEILLFIRLYYSVFNINNISEKIKYIPKIFFYCIYYW